MKKWGIVAILFIALIVGVSFYNGEEKVNYIGNRNTKKFHELGCDSIDNMKDINKKELYSRIKAIELGYIPCGICKP